MKKMLGKRFMFLVALLVGLCVPTMAQTSETATKTIDANSKASGKVDEEKSAEYSSNGTIGGTSYNQTPYLSIGSNSPLTISVPSGYMITEIKLSYTSSSSNRRGGTKTVKTYNGETQVSYTGSTSGATSSTYTISGISNDVNKVTITGDNTSRITKIEVTYKAAGLSVNGTVYYIQNAATGLFLTYGGEWGFFAVEGRSAHPMVVNTNGDYKSLGSVAGYLGSNELWMDRPVAESKWKFESTGTGVAGSTGQFYIKNENGVVLASQGNRYGQLALRPQDEEDSRHKWNLYTKEQLLALSASVDNPVDITAIIQASSFDLADGQSLDAGPLKSISPFSTLPNLPSSGETEYQKKRFIGFWGNYPYPYDNYNWHSMIRGGWGQPGVYNGIGIIKNTTNKVTITQNIGTLKQGTYYFSFQGFYRYLVEETINYIFGSYTSTSDATMNVKVKIVYGNNNATIKEFTLSRNNRIEIGEGIDNYEDAATLLKDYVSHEQHYQFTVPQSGYSNVKVIIEKPETSSDYNIMGSGAKYYNWACFDNFALVYYGTNVGNTQVDFNELYESWLEKFIDEIVDRVNEFNDDAKELFDISDVIANIGNVDNEAEYLEALEKIANEFQEAYNKQFNSDDQDVTTLIKNPTFADEIKDEWSNATRISKSGNVSSSDYTEADTRLAKNNSGLPIIQTITNIEPGLYRLTAWITAEPGNTVYLMANHFHKGIVATDYNKLQKVELEFLAEDNNKTAILGVVPGSGPNNKYYKYDGNAYAGCNFKVDNFTLYRICNLANGRLKFELDKANAAVFDEFVTPDMFDYSMYQSMYDARQVANDATTDFGYDPALRVMDILRNAAKKQRSENADMTYAIYNQNIDYWMGHGWVVDGPGGVAVNTGGPATHVTDAEGKHLIDSWQPHSTAQGTGARITQTIENLPKGDYELKAVVASGNHGNPGTVYLTAETSVQDEIYKTSIADPSCGSTMNEITLNFSVGDDGVAVIGVVGGSIVDGSYIETGDRIWFKADNFRLKYCGHKLTLNEKAEEIKSINDWYTTVTLNRTLKANSTWSSFCAPFDIAAELLTGWDVKELTSSSVSENGEHITLRFTDATDGIKAGVPYMVRNTSLTEAVTSFPVSNVRVNTNKIPSLSTDHVVFRGVYTRQQIPAGAYFISDNKFYKAVDTSVNTSAKPDMISGFRGYFHVLENDETANVRSLILRIEEEGTDDIEIVEAEESTPTVVAIYNLAGVRLSTMQPGVNILRMSNGTTETRIVK